MDQQAGGKSLGEDWRAAAERSAIAARSIAPLLVTVREAGELLGISERSIYNLISAGELRVVKLGRSSRIPIGDVHAVIDTRMLSPAGMGDVSPTTTTAPAVPEAIRKVALRDEGPTVLIAKEWMSRRTQVLGLPQCPAANVVPVPADPSPGRRPPPGGNSTAPQRTVP